MSFTFRPAKRQNVSLLIGLSAPSGGGKTYTALKLATGMVKASGGKICVIDTEAGRALHYADQFTFEHGDLKAPFSPGRYAEAIVAADAAGYEVIVVDSASHEHAGEGGILDMQEAELKRMGGGENVKMASWIKPKGEHKRMMQKLLQVRAHIILCFRAEAKIEMGKDANGRTVVQPKKSLTSVEGWIPICEKSLPFELTASFLLTPDAPGVPKPIKLQEQHRAFFPAGKPITEASGAALAGWAAGGVVKAAPVATAPQGGPAAGTFSGVCGLTETREDAGRTVFDVTVGDELFSTLDADLGARASGFKDTPVVVTFTTTKRGGKMLATIHDPEDPGV